MQHFSNEIKRDWDGSLHTELYEELITKKRENLLGEIYKFEGKCVIIYLYPGISFPELKDTKGVLIVAYGA